jgi:hypothetical protein
MIYHFYQKSHIYVNPTGISGASLPDHGLISHSTFFPDGQETRMSTPVSDARQTKRSI